ncbi:MAG: hypothetical protein II444_05755 [Firmicutes bacterium]|nr:hypothetical protein [Bacillota bacterium]
MKYSGLLGFAETKETAPSVWEEVITEKKYFGDVKRVIKRYQPGEERNENISYSNSIEIVADPFVRDNLQNLRYVTWLNSKWRIANIQVNYPRFIIELGGVYNGPEE